MEDVEEAGKTMEVEILEKKKEEEVSESTVPTNSSHSDEQQQGWTVKFYTNKVNKYRKANQCILLKIFGDDAKTRKYKFSSVNEKTFQRGKIEIFNIKTRYIGIPTQIICKNTGEGDIPDLNLQKLELLNEANEVFTFEHNQPIPKDSSVTLKRKVERKKCKTKKFKIEFMSLTFFSPSYIFRVYINI